MRRIKFRQGTSAETVHDALRTDVAAYLEGVGGDDELLALAERLGTVIEPGVGMPGAAHDGHVYSVEVRNEGRGLVDEHGNVIVSSTNRPFAPHTDGYNRTEPPRLVFLLRSDTSEDETPTFVNDARELADVLPDGVLARLREQVFPSSRGPIALLTQDEGGEECLRFNLEEIERWNGEAPNRSMDERTSAAVASLVEALRRREESVVIESGDCLVIDNHRATHGRGALRSDSKRILKRVWVT